LRLVPFHTHTHPHPHTPTPTHTPDQSRALPPRGHRRSGLRDVRHGRCEATATYSTHNSAEKRSRRTRRCWPHRIPERPSWGMSKENGIPKRQNGSEFLENAKGHTPGHSKNASPQPRKNGLTKGWEQHDVAFSGLVVASNHRKVQATFQGRNNATLPYPRYTWYV
jgi:hypothetical protein